MRFFGCRGSKSTGWEGAVRGVATVYYPRGLPIPSHTNCLFHATDWIPTLVSMYDEAKGNVLIWAPLKLYFVSFGLHSNQFKRAMCCPSFEAEAASALYALVS